MQRRKGSPTDIPLLMIILFFLAVSIVIALYANTIIKNVIDTTPLNSSAAYNDINSSFTNINSYGVQRGFTLMFGILMIGILVSAFLVRIHPVWIFIYIIFLGVSIFISIYLANTYALLVENNILAGFADNYKTITFVMQHVAKILLAVGALSMIIIFGKLRNPNDSGSDL